MLAGFLTPGRHWTFVGGKGGVGKTTVAAALAVELAESGRDVIVLSVDPAHSLGDALGLALGPDPAPVEGVVHLTAAEVSATLERQRFLKEHEHALTALIERGTYLDAEDSRGITRSALPGIDEIAALLSLARSVHSPERVIIDTAPTGHTLRLLELPELALKWVAALEAMERKHAAVSVGLIGRYQEDSSSDFLGGLRADLEQTASLFRDPEATRFVLVTTADRVVLAETLRYQAELERRGIALGGIVVNRQKGTVLPVSTGVGMVFVPWLDVAPVGIAGLRRFADAATSSPDDASEPATGALRGNLHLAPFDLPVNRSLYLVVGKGGVGKSTVAAGLSVQLANRGLRVLLLSVDPAGSLGDLLGMPVGEDPAAVEGVPGLMVRQIDANASWETFRSRYRERAEPIFDRLVPGGAASASLDRDVVERLVDLAPPGLDELVALLEVIDLTEDREYDAIVVDTAPTGHMLRLLRMPDVALEWCHTLLRLLLKYRDVIPLGALAADVLNLASDIRRFQGRLTDADATWLMAVALPEALSIPETERLFAAVRELGVEPGALLINRSIVGDHIALDRSTEVGRLMAISSNGTILIAPDLRPPPVGTAGLGSFVQRWRSVSRRTPGALAPIP